MNNNNNNINSNSHHNNNNIDTQSSEAIIDLYLAIKIRSTEELEKIDEDHLDKEKNKLLKEDGFQILKYIRSSIEIIMNLKIEDLEKEMTMKRNHITDFIPFLDVYDLL